MGTLDLMPKPETAERELLFSRIKILKEKFPDIGVVCNGMRPIEKKIEVCNMAEPPAMQFRPKNIEEMRKLVAEIKETSQNTSIHLEDLKFNEETGAIDPAQKEEMIEILGQPENKNNFKTITMHLGWRDAATVLNEEGKWKDTELADKLADGWADLFGAGIEAGRVMTIENSGYTEKDCEILGTKPEHLAAARDKISEIISQRTDKPLEEILSKIGYTFDMGHVTKNNAQLKEQCSIETWLEQLGKDIKLMHIHDVLPNEALPDDRLPDGHKNRNKKDHKSLGRGLVDWKSFFELKKQYCPDVPMILEINDDGTGANTVESVDYLEKLGQ